MLTQSLQQKLLQKLSPLQIQTIKLLELPVLELDQCIKKELEENPMLEEGGEKEVESGDKTEELAMSDYYGDSSTPSYRLYVNNQPKDEPRKEYPGLSVKESFQQHLESQLGYRQLSDRDRELALFIIGSLDGDGYLRRDLESLADDIAFKIGWETTAEELGPLLKIIQEFDPVGIGARDVQECLLLQLEAKTETPQIDAAKQMLKDCFPEFSKKHYDKIKLRLSLSDIQLKETVDEVIKLNPRPGGNMDDSYNDQAQQVMPDFFVEVKDGEIQMSMPRFSLPELKLNKRYADMLMKSVGSSGREAKEAVSFVRQKLDSAKWFIEALRQRKITLTSTMNGIIDFQRDFFMEGDEAKLKPMVLKNVAEKTGLDISTISRVVNSKYVQTHFGIYSLKYFFSEGMVNEQGEEVSNREIKNLLLRDVSGEDKSKPLTDEELVSRLQERGYKVARRTVAKYREQLNIPIARLRKAL
ncbi:MAG: RNA polymerase factor sigma-54 [Bacteroidales bacterium]|nr:RNA polymerase factor sigma-54 [Bacteroidales bacterium]MCL2738943.1 RNA polymerase factor sigma-54 [Bacteroidales bacterium]